MHKKICVVISFLLVLMLSAKINASESIAGIKRLCKQISSRALVMTETKQKHFV